MPIEVLDTRECPDHGEMTLLLTVGGVRIVECDTCHRVVALGGDRGFVPLIKGDFWATHRFCIGPIDIHSISLKVSSHTLDSEADTDWAELFQPPGE